MRPKDFDPAFFAQSLTKELEAYDSKFDPSSLDCSQVKREAYDAIRESIIEGYKDEARQGALVSARFRCT
jgi:hypothetical protein